MTARDHNRLLSIFYFIQAGLALVLGAIFFVVYVVIGGVMMSSSSRQDEQMMGGVVAGMGVIIAIVLLALGAFALFTGLKVRKEQPIGRILGIVVSFLVLFSFPIGTALGIYGLWFFFGDLGKNLYAGGQPGSYVPPPPPQPGNWQ